MEQETITLTRAELKKVLVVEKILEGHMTNKEGAATLGITDRQMIRLKKKYQTAGGAQALVHGNRGRKPKHALPDGVREKAVKLYTEKYYDSNCCHFAELLEEHETLTISASSVRRILLAEGIKQAKPRRRSKAHQPRERRAQAGMLWQTDATSFAWLEDRAGSFALHAAIDDATGVVVAALFRPTECLEGYSRVMQQGIQIYGVPLGLYSDRHTIFRSPNEALSVEQELAGEAKPLSNFGKALSELHIEHIKAVTPQAKGRIERLWRTFQDRLVIELRLLAINSLEEANAVLPQLVDKHNRLFAVEPSESQCAYMPLDPAVDLNHVFSRRDYRKLGSGNTISYKGTIYTLATSPLLRLTAKTTVEVRETFDGEVLLWVQGQPLALKSTTRPVSVKKPATKKASSAQPRKPASTHPWRNSKGTLSSNHPNTAHDSFQDAIYSQHNRHIEAAW